MLMMMIFMLVASIFVCQSLQGPLYDESIALSSRLWVNRYYGTSLKAGWTLFELTFSGGWPNYARPLVEDIDGSYACFFFIYVTFVVFGVTRIVTALFLQETMKASARDVEYQVQKTLADTTAFLNKISDLFVAADVDGGGYLSLDEFTSVLTNESVRAYLASIGVEVFEVEGLFNVLADGDDQISYEEFLDGIWRLKGAARSQDVLAILHKLTQLKREFSAMTEFLHGPFSNELTQLQRQDNNQLIQFNQDDFTKMSQGIQSLIKASQGAGNGLTKARPISRI